MSPDIRFMEKLEKNCNTSPENIALISVEFAKSLTYAKLWEYSGRVYSFLKHESIGKEDIVMIALPRGISPVIALKMNKQELQAEILRLKKEKDICILAHAYQDHELCLPGRI